MLVPPRNFAWRLVACLVFIVCAVSYAQLHFYRDPGSAFFDQTRAYEQRYSRHRNAQAQQYINTLNDSWDIAPGQAGADPALCVGLSSVKRRHTQYLDTTVASLLHGLAPPERADLYLSVLVAEMDPAMHPSWHQDWLHRAVDDLYSYNITDREETYLRDLVQARDYTQKGVYDYVYALRRCYDRRTPYIGMFEDDILVADGWLTRTLLALHQIDNPRGRRPWLFMRLFNQERSTGWASRRIGGNHELVIILGIGLGLTLSVILARRLRWRLALTYVDWGTVALVVLLLNPALVILFFQSGKASLLPPAPGVFEEPFGCCSQAMLFPRMQVPSLVDFLERRNRGQIDLLLDDWAREANLARYAMYPVQAQHIGLYSARKTQIDEAQAIWSMAYEDLDADAVEQAHSQTVDDYYGPQQ